MTTTDQPTPTPETDAMAASTYSDEAHKVIDFARRLERERDEARLALEISTKAQQAIFTQVTDSLTAERDAAIAEREKLRDALGKVVQRDSDPYTLLMARKHARTLLSTPQAVTI